MTHTYVVVEWPSLEVIAVFDDYAGAYNFCHDTTAPLHIFEYERNSHKRRSVWNRKLNETQLRHFDALVSYKYVKASPELLAKALRKIMSMRTMTEEQLAANIKWPVEEVRRLLANTPPTMDTGANDAGKNDDSAVVDLDGGTHDDLGGDTRRGSDQGISE